MARVPSDGGMPTTIATSKGERYLLPQLLPDGKTLVFTVIANDEAETTNVVLQPLAGGEPRVLIQGGADARYVGTGHLVFMKSGTLAAVPFDLRSLRVTGAAVPLIDNVMQGINAPSAF